MAHTNLTPRTVGHIGLSLATGRSHEIHPVAVWLCTHEDAVTVLLFKGFTVVMGMLLLVIIRPMGTRHAWVRAVT